MAKWALCIGINDYPGTKLDLAGCVNDANDWAALLKARGYTVDMLLDAQATKARMVAGISDLIGSAASGDSVVITYSGHGTYAPDTDGDEPDGLDEALCPYDIQQQQVLIDDEIHHIFARRAKGVRIVLISDSCHSGTVIREAAPDPQADAPRKRFMPMGTWLPEAQLPRAANGQVALRAPVMAAQSPWVGALSAAEDDLLLAGCEEGRNNFSFDARIAGRANGAFTYYALKALKTLAPGATYRQWHNEIRKFLPSGSYPQSPQLFGAKSAKGRKVLE